MTDSERAGDYFQLGYTVFQLCHRDGFQHKTLVRQASSLLQQSSQLNPADPRPLICLAYLMLVFNDIGQARAYLARALQVNPRDVQALQLQKTLLNLEQGIVETADGQQLTMVRRLDEQLRDQETHKRLQIQKRHGHPVRQKSVQPSSRAVSEPPSESERQVVAVPEQVETFLLPLPETFLSPSQAVSIRVRQALGLPDPDPARSYPDDWDPALTSALRQFQNQQRLPLHGKLDPATVRALNDRLSKVRIYQELGQNLVACLLPQTAVAAWPEARLPLLVEDLIQQIRACTERFPLVADQNQAAVPMIQADLGPKGQAGIVSQGQQVEWLQQVLVHQGYALQINGQFDMQTYTALRHWQQTQHVEATGYVTAQVKDQLNTCLQTLHQEAMTATPFLYLIREALTELNQAWTIQLETLVVPWQHWFDYWCQLGSRPHAGWPDQELGTTGRLQRQGMAVMILQENLTLLGIPVPITGVYDSETQTAVRQLQRQHKLPINGQFDARTLNVFREISIPLSNQGSENKQ